jgi:hypothetical protein
MNEEKIKEVCEERLAHWTQGLVSEHATPIILVGVGHDHNAGMVTVYTCQEITDQEIALFLMSVLNRLQNGKVKR